MVVTLLDCLGMLSMLTAYVYLVGHVFNTSCLFALIAQIIHHYTPLDNFWKRYNKVGLFLLMSLIMVT